MADVQQLQLVQTPALPRRKFLYGLLGLTAASTLASIGLKTALPAPNESLANLEQATFAGQLNGTFFVPTGLLTSLSLKLIEVRDLRLEGQSGEVFLLRFEGDGGLGLAQGIYKFANNALGIFPLFIKPIGSNRYEAILNRLQTQ